MDDDTQLRSHVAECRYLAGYDELATAGALGISDAHHAAPLDSERALAVTRILNQRATRYHTAIIVVTHDEKIIPTFKRNCHIREACTIEEAGEGRAL